MFRESIMSTPLTTDTANEHFRGIIDGTCGTDNTLISTMRALVAPRLGDGEAIILSYNRSDYSAETIGSVTINRALDAMCNSHNIEEMNGSFHIHYFNNSHQDSNYACLKVIEQGFEHKYDGYHRLEKITEFFRKSFYVVCFINPEKKNVVVFLEDTNIRNFHYLQCSIPAMFPWYFTDSAISETEMELIQSLRERTPEKYNACIAKIAEAYDFRSIRIRRVLKGFETQYERVEIQKEKDGIANIDGRIRDYNNSIGALLAQRNESCIRLLGLEAKIASGNDEDSEIMEYFLCNNRVVLDDANDGVLTFYARDYLTYFDKDAAETMINNATSYIYVNDNGDFHRGFTSEHLKLLMEAIFVRETLKIKFCAHYRFNFRGNVTPLTIEIMPPECNNHMKNPHIDRYHCLGNYERVINDLLQSHNYIPAIEQCIASCKSLNFHDSTVMHEFMRGIISAGAGNFIELPDGSMATPREAVKWLEAEEVKNEQEEAEEA